MTRIAIGIRYLILVFLDIYLFLYGFELFVSTLTVSQKTVTPVKTGVQMF